MPVREAERHLRLLAAAIGERSRLSERAARVSNWEAVVDAALDHALAGVLYRALRQAEFELPEPLANRIERVLARDRLWHRRLSLELDGILRAFDRQQVRAVVLKGPPLAERLYPEPALRPSGDIDLLIHPRATEVAAAILADLGYGPHLAERGEIQSPHALKFDHPELVTVELHRMASSRLGTELPGPELVERARLYTRGGHAAAWVLAPEDELLYLAVHNARHRFLRLGWLYDVKLLLGRYPELDQAWLVRGARENRVSRAVVLTLRLLRQRLETDALEGLQTELRSGLGVAAAAALCSLATDRSRFYSERTSTLDKVYRVSCDHTYAALLGEERRFRSWMHGLATSARRSAG